MIDPELRKAMQAEDKFFGLQQGLKIYSAYPFGSMNQQNSRQGIEDTDFFWSENFIKIGQANLRTVWDQGTPIYTAPGGTTIVYFFFFNIGTSNFVAIFLSDGTALQLNTATMAQTIISSTANTFYVGGQLPIAAQWGANYVLIANNINSNAYWIWDRFTLYTSGGVAPQVTITASGSGYSSPPTVTFFGGQGTGAQGTATVTAGAVTAVQITNTGSGYKPGDVVQIQFSGGGSDNGAILTPVLTATSVASIALLAGGSGYTSPTITITGGGGSSATAVCTQSGGIINSITLTAGGSGFTSMPTITINDSTGVGAIAQCLLTPTTVASVTVTNGGTNFQSTPTIKFVGGGASTAATVVVTLSGKAISSIGSITGGTGYTSVPAVVVASGINNAAMATATLMPFGVSGTSIETFQSRVWIPSQYASGNNLTGGQFLVSAPGSVTDFATSDGGLQFTSTDSYLKARYTNIKQSNGYLYPIGDSSVSVISNVQTSGSPPVTTFNYQNTDPQTGTNWRDSVALFSRTILMGNPFGIFALYGGAVTKISKKMDNIFNTAVSPANGGVTPTSAVANIFAIKIFLFNMTITDPFTMKPRTVMLAWDEQNWFIVSQSSAFTFIGTQEVTSNLLAWGTDGNSLYPMLNYPSALTTKKLSTKLYGQERFLIQDLALGVYVQYQDLSPGAQGVSLASLTVDACHGSYPVPNIPVFPAGAPPYYPVVSIGSGDIVGDNLGLTLTSNSLDFTLSYIGLSHIEVGSIAMSSDTITGQINTE